ncbi:hypothetical protein JCM3765_005371, partial [Sporobolomyces pararoseus]
MGYQPYYKHPPHLMPPPQHVYAYPATNSKIPYPTPHTLPPAHNPRPTIEPTAHAQRPPLPTIHETPTRPSQNTNQFPSPSLIGTPPPFPLNTVPPSAPNVNHVLHTHGIPPTPPPPPSLHPSFTPPIQTQPREFKTYPNWVPMLNAIWPNTSVSEGLTQDNWTRWHGEVMRQIVLVGRVETMILEGTATPENWPDPHEFKIADVNVRNFLMITGGAAVKGLLNKDGHEILPILRRRFHLTASSAQRFKSFQTLFSLQHDGTSPLRDHWDEFNKLSTWLIKSGLPRSFWFLAVQAAAYVYNRLPHSSNDNCSPYSRYFGSVPDISNLRTFGCVAHVLIDAGQRDKLSPRTSRCIFVGYVENRKGWLFYNAATQRFMTGVNVKWFEDHFITDEGFEWLQREREELARWNPLEDDGTLEGGVERGGENGGRQDLLSTIAHPPTLPASTSPSTDNNDNDTDVDPPEVPLPSPSSPTTTSDSPPATIPLPQRDGYRLLPPKDESYDSLGDKWKAQSSSRLRPRSLARILQTRTPPTALNFVHSVLETAALDPSIHPSDPSVAEAAEIDDDGNFALVRLAGSDNPDSPSFKAAMSREDRAQWMTAVEAELTAMKERGVFDENLEDLPRGGKAIPLKWVLLVKRDEYGHVIKYKARLVARGDLQRPGIDFSEVFSSTIRFTSILVLLALAVTKNWDIVQFDVSTAFLHAKLDDKVELFVRQPPGFVDSQNPLKVHRLRKSLYGLRQAGRLWSEHFIGCLRDMGFEQSKADESLFVRWKDGKVAIIPIHVDDGLVMGTDDLKSIVKDLSSRLDNSVKEEPLGLFLGVKISRLEDGSITLDQAHYVDKLAERFDFDGKSQRQFLTPFDRNTDISPRREDEPKFEGPYRELLGAVVYLSTCTRPDISYTVSIASRFASDPAPRHHAILKRLLRYLIKTRSLGLRFSPGTPLSLSGFSDADHGADPDTRRSITGRAFTMAGAA